MSITKHSVDVIPSLAELADQVRREHEQVVRSYGAMLEHAMSAGEALMSAQRQMTFGEWGPWLKQNCAVSPKTAALYMRIHEFRDEVKASGVDSISQARHVLTIAGLTRDSNGPNSASAAEARELCRSGVSIPEIARLYGLNIQTVRGWCLTADEQKRQRQAIAAQRKRREQEKAALRRQEADAAARATSDDVGEAYSLMRKLEQVVGRATRDASSPILREHLEEAGRATRKLDDALSKAVKSR